MFTLNDQRRGGSIMWSGGMIIDAIWISFAVYHWIKSEERAAISIDAEIAREKAEDLVMSEKNSRDYQTDEPSVDS